MLGVLFGHGRVHWRTKAGLGPNEGHPLCPQNHLIPFLLYRMQNLSQYMEFLFGANLPVWWGLKDIENYSLTKKDLFEMPFFRNLCYFSRDHTKRSQKLLPISQKFPLALLGCKDSFLKSEWAPCRARNIVLVLRLDIRWRLVLTLSLMTVYMCFYFAIFDTSQ